MLDPHWFRRRAADCRALRKSVNSELDRGLLEDMADELDAEADRMEAEAERPPPGT
jgi:hypothetical protein